MCILRELLLRGRAPSYVQIWVIFKNRSTEKVRVEINSQIQVPVRATPSSTTHNWFYKFSNRNPALRLTPDIKISKMYDIG